MPERRIWRARIRTLLLVVLPLLTVGLFAVVFRQSWTSNSADARFATDERSRVAYLRPLNHLVGALVEARSAAVQGTAIDAGAVESAVGLVDAADRQYRDVLHTGQRWATVRARINAEVAKPGSGPAALTTFSESLTLVLDLVQRVGDTSDLILDPQLDSYYIMNTALLRLPQVIVAAGYAGDLATLATGGTLTPDNLLRVAVARHDVAEGAADASAGLNRSIETTSRDELGANLAGQLDGFRAAVDQLAPSSVLGAQTGPVDVDSLPPAAGTVRVTALALGDAVLSELDALLAGRQDSLTGQRRIAIGVAVGVVVLAILLLWLARPRGTPAPPSAAETSASHEEVPPLFRSAELVPAGSGDHAG